jgi:small subunit ribosomal protein S16
MAVAIRLKRFGTKKDTCFRIIVCDERVPRDGKVIEEIGFYDPAPNPHQIKVNAERAKYWVSVGAKVSDTVRSLLKRASVQRTAVSVQESNS